MARVFVLHKDPRTVSTAQAVQAMLAGDPRIGDGKTVPLFHDSRTGKELVLDYTAR